MKVRALGMMATSFVDKQVIMLDNILSVVSTTATIQSVAPKHENSPFLWRTVVAMSQSHEADQVL
jgi:hypothetical protein